MAKKHTSGIALALALITTARSTRRVLALVRIVIERMKFRGIIERASFEPSGLFYCFGCLCPMARPSTPTFDSSISSDPAVVVTINMAIQVYENLFSNPINVRIYFQAGSGLGG